MGKRGKRKKQQLKAARREARRYKSTNQLMLKLTIVSLVISGIGVLFGAGQFFFGDNLVARVTQTPPEIVQLRKDHQTTGRSRSKLSQVEITSPVNNSSFSLGTPVTIAAVASPGDSRITKVDFYAGKTLLGSSPQP